MDKNNFHKSVLLQEAVDNLRVKPGCKYIDATLGGGGHTLAILEQGGVVLGVDQDQEAVEHVKEKFKVQSAKLKVGKDVILVRGNFRDIGEIARLHGFPHVSGVLFDLGVSSHQFDTSTRGFSFQTESPLDMRMDDRMSVKAADLVNGLTKRELEELFIKLGEERFARRIADTIIRERQFKKIATTGDLVDIIQMATPRVKATIHPATRVFQALRIAVNDELNSLREALPKAIELLRPGGRMVVISFHSLEDRIVKNTFQEFENNQEGSIITKKPVMASEEEKQSNNRARSAKLRVIEKN